MLAERFRSQDNASPVAEVVAQMLTTTIACFALLPPFTPLTPGLEWVRSSVGKTCHAPNSPALMSAAAAADRRWEKTASSAPRNINSSATTVARGGGARGPGGPP